MSKTKCSNFRKAVEVLDSECEACTELMQIRATMLVNFSKNDNSYGFVIKDEGTTHEMLVEVLEGLTHKEDMPESKDKPFRVVYIDTDGKVGNQLVDAPTEAHARVLFGRTGIQYKEITRVECMKG